MKKSGIGACPASRLSCRLRGKKEGQQLFRHFMCSKFGSFPSPEQMTSTLEAHSFSVVDKHQCSRHALPTLCHSMDLLQLEHHDQKQPSTWT